MTVAAPGEMAEVRAEGFCCCVDSYCDFVDAADAAFFDRVRICLSASDGFDAIDAAFLSKRMSLC